MKSFSRIVVAVAVCFAGSDLPAQDAAKPADDAAARAADAKKAAASSDPAITETLTKTVEKAKSKLESAADKATGAAATPKKGTTKSSVPDPSDPANWGKNEVHKLAIMDVKYGGDTRTIMFELFEKEAPRTVANFADNCASGSYNGLAVHRAIDGYLVQTGDPLSSDESARDRWGTGGEEKTIPAEIKRPHKLGSVAMARRGDKVNPSKKSNGYQFYFALGNMAALDGQYTVFGQVISGIETLERISRVPADSNDCPLERIEVKSIQVVDQKGPLLVLRETPSGKRRYTKPAAAKGGLEKFIERIW